MNVLDILKSQHNQIKNLFKEVGDTMDKNLEAQIVNQLAGHTFGEDSIFYPALSAKAETAGIVEEAKAEHVNMDSLVSKMQAIHTQDAWLEAVKELKASVLKHIKEEESEMFPLVKANFSEEELESIGSVMQA